MFTVKKVKFADLKEIVKEMKGRAEKAKNNAAVSMIGDFEEEKKKCEYFLAKVSSEKYGLMSLSAPPKIKSGENSIRLDDMIDKSIWVEGLVADSKSGLGDILLIVAELYAIDNKKPYVTLAAYEYDQDPQPDEKYRISKPYSVAAYYAEKQGYVFTGEGYVEDKGDKKLIYPIYYKDVTRMQQILRCTSQLKDEFKYIQSKL